MASIGMAQPVAADPWSTGLMAAGSVASKALEKGSSQAAGTNSNNADFSAWTLSIGSSGATSAAVEKTTTTPTAGLLSNPIVLAGLAVAVVLYLRK